MTEDRTREGVKGSLRALLDTHPALTYRDIVRAALMEIEHLEGDVAQLAALGRLTDAVERLAGYYATVHNLGLTQCPECGQLPNDKGQIFHISGCGALWPDPTKLHIPGEGL